MLMCVFEGCLNSKILGRGYCSKHYMRLLKYGDPSKVAHIRGDDKARLWSKIATGTPTECWPWTAKSMIDGYGVIQIGGRGGKSFLAHRYVWEITNGPIPQTNDYHGTVVLHICDNRKCCNPSHLRLGTQSENVLDMDRKGRRRVVVPFGATHHNTKLTNDDIRFIRSSEKSNADLGRQFNVCRSTIRRIRLTGWQHVK